jgi:ubiquinone biosynthesis protein
VARLLNDVYAEQIFRLGWLHADPHPGNLLVQAVPRSGPSASSRRGPGSGPRLVLLDHGLTVPLKPDTVEALREMVAALLDGDFARLNCALGKAGVRLDEDLDVATLLQLVGVVLGGEGRGSISATAVGRQLAKGVGHVPTDLLLVGRALGLLDGITKQLDSDLNALAAIADYVSTADHAPTPGV